MKKIRFLLLALQCIVLSALAQVKVDHLRTENLKNPIGINVLQPHFSWQLISDQRNVSQSAYEIIVVLIRRFLITSNISDMKYP